MIMMSDCSQRQLDFITRSQWKFVNQKSWQSNWYFTKALLIAKYENWSKKPMRLTLNNMSWVQMKIGNSKAAFEPSLMAFAQMKAYPFALKHYALSWANFSAILSMLQLLICWRISI